VIADGEPILNLRKRRSSRKGAKSVAGAGARFDRIGRPRAGGRGYMDVVRLRIRHRYAGPARHGPRRCTFPSFSSSPTSWLFCFDGDALAKAALARPGSEPAACRST